MAHWLDRTELLIGAPALRRLGKARVAVIGLGGVGGAAAEAVCRAGVGSLLVMDHDVVDITNCNRQLFATAQTVGMDKCRAAADRLLSINPALDLISLPKFYGEETREELFEFCPDFVIDAIDTVTSKLDLAQACRERQVPLVMCMGTGNRLDPTAFCTGTIEDTAGCGCALARVMRRELKRRGITGQPVVYSVEPPLKRVAQDSPQGRHSPASISFCPPAAGYALASYVINQLMRRDLAKDD